MAEFSHRFGFKTIVIGGRALRSKGDVSSKYGSYFRGKIFNINMKLTWLIFFPKIGNTNVL